MKIYTLLAKMVVNGCVIIPVIHVTFDIVCYLGSLVRGSEVSLAVLSKIHVVSER